MLRRSEAERQLQQISVSLPAQKAVKDYYTIEEFKKSLFGYK